MMPRIVYVAAAILATANALRQTNAARLTLFVALAAIQTSVTAEITRTVPQRAPSFFVLDVPRDKPAGEVDACAAQNLSIRTATVTSTWTMSKSSDAGCWARTR